MSERDFFKIYAPDRPLIRREPALKVGVYLGKRVPILAAMGLFAVECTLARELERVVSARIASPTQESLRGLDLFVWYDTAECYLGGVDLLMEEHPEVLFLCWTLNEWQDIATECALEIHDYGGFANLVVKDDDMGYYIGAWIDTHGK